ncbi:hypothetical protein BKI52_20445 [marine bacterium AO1-C]|nr:hypothetical protein BKI52_20445 [marine bacterium AO1-C]
MVYYTLNRGILVMALLCLCISMSFNKAYAQETHKKEFCGTEATPKQIEYMETLRSTIQNSNRLRATTSLQNLVYIPIKAHIVRKSNGVGGLDLLDLLKAMENLNNKYRVANMAFYLYESINYIDNDAYYNFSSSDESAMAFGNDVANVINIYFVQSARSGTSNVCGYARFPNGSSGGATDRIIMVNSCTTNGSTYPHELGHYFSLYHTHGKTNTGTTDELVDGSNCTTAGDDICDTPADPNLSGQVNTDGCTYTGTATDANGDLYTPDATNLMSYSPSTCRSNFSQGQYDRIVGAFTNSRNYLLTRTTPPPTIGSFTSNNDQIVIQGSGFSLNAGDNIVAVNGVPAVVTSSTNTQLVVNMPANASTGLITVSVNQQLAISTQSILVTVSAFPYTESFEQGLGDWTQSIEDDFNWSINAGGTPSVSTGPTNATDGSEYLYTEASGNNNPGKVTYLTSTYFDLSTLTTPKFSFSYHMFGGTMGTLTLEISDDNGQNWTSLWTQTGDQGNNWNTETLDLANYQGKTVQFRFVGTTGSSWQSDIAIDHIQVNNTGAIQIASVSPSQVSVGETFTITGTGFSAIPSENIVKINGVLAQVTGASATSLQVVVPIGATSGKITVISNGKVAVSAGSILIPITVYPYSEGFERGFGVWSQNVADSIDWTRGLGSTPSASTGPSSAAEGDFYLFTEASNPNFPDKVAIITSAPFELANLIDPIFTFSYHMFGGSMGTLTLEVIRGSETTWTTLWTQTGDQGDEWKTQTIDLSAYQNEAVQFRFVGTTGSSWQSDMAIDNIIIDGKQVTISSFSPAIARQGDTITITGLNFQPGDNDNVVKFNGLPATILSATETQLMVIVPENATSGKVTVTINTGQTGTSTTDFLVIPEILSVSPLHGKEGDLVTIQGKAFSPTASKNIVSFGGVATVADSVNGNALYVTVPVGALTGQVTVAVRGQVATSTDVFVVAPTITAFLPDSGRVGDEITIIGTNFVQGNSHVRLNGRWMTTTSVTPTEIKAIVPYHAVTGKVTVKIGRDVAVSPVDFKIFVLKPTITDFFPKSGQRGDTITITGTNFEIDYNRAQVRLNGRWVPVVERSVTTLKVVIPYHAATGKFTVKVGQEIATAAEDFIVNEFGTTYSLYPNPTAGLVHFQIQGMTNEPATVRVFDRDGQEVLQNQMNLQQGTFTLDISSLPAGRYIFKIQLAQQVITRTIIKN